LGGETLLYLEPWVAVRFNTLYRLVNPYIFL
jgi:hypothetical protein